MRILLVNPPTTHMVKHTTSLIDSFVKDNAVPPLGLMYLASYVEKATEHEVKICDMNVGDPLISVLVDWKPDVVGVTATTLTLYDALDVLVNVKWVNKNIVTVMGGAHCSIYPQEVASFSEVDYVIQGEGELPFLRVLRGITGKIAEVEIIEDADSKPFPARHLIDISKYHSTLAKKLMTTVCTSAGCPMFCSFCYQPHYGKQIRMRSVKSVVDEMESIIKMGIGEIEIMDDTFTFDNLRVLKICYDIISRGLKVKWNIRTRVDKVDKRMLFWMKQAGCQRINYGIESYVPETLKTLRKGFKVEQINQAIQWTKEAGIEVQAYLMLGSPDETKEQMMQTIKSINKAKPDYAYYSITAPMPCTSMYKRGLDEGRYEDYWRNFAKNPIPDFKSRIWREDIKDEVIDMMNYGYKSFYFRPSYILGQIGRVKSIQELVRKGRMALSMVK